MVKTKLTEFDKNLMKAMGMEAKDRIVVENPRMTINKLAEWIIADPHRQRQILSQLKYPKENQYGAIIHADIRNAIKEYLTSEYDDSILERCIQQLESKKGKKEKKAQQDQSFAEIIKTLINSKSVEKEAFQYELYTGKNPKYEIEGVEVSVYPDLIVKSFNRGREYIGAMKLHLSKTYPLGEEGTKYVAAMVYKFTDDYLKNDGLNNRVDHNICFEVFSDSFIQSPTDHKTKWKQIVAACRSIADIWPSI